MLQMKDKPCSVKGIKRNFSWRDLKIRPVVKRYFIIAPADIALANDFYIIYPSQCVDDNGATPQKFENAGRSGYYNLFINGVMQGSSFYHIKSSRLMLTPTGQTIYKGTPIVIESVSFKMTVKK